MTSGPTRSGAVNVSDRTGTDVLIDHLSRLYDNGQVRVCHDNEGGDARWWVEVNGAQITPVSADAGSMRQALKYAFSQAVERLFDRPPVMSDEEPF